MPLPTPNLDDRQFQDILDEARRRIPVYCPEWTDHNLSDPGITMLELFSWMTDMLLYRLNRVPDKNYVKFLDLIGIKLEPARAATTNLTVRLSAAQPEDVVIPRGTEVATVRTETLEAVTFSTDRDLSIRIPILEHVLASRGGSRFHDYKAAISNPRQGLGIFQDVPQENDALYLGFEKDLSAHILALSLDCRMEGIGVDPRDPPLAWETWSQLDGGWSPVRLEEDSTGGLNRSGLVILHTDFDSNMTVIDGKMAYWLRCRVLAPKPGQSGYSDTPRIMGIEVSSLGGMVPISHASRVFDQTLGISDGTPGQRFPILSLPILPREKEDVVEVQDADGIFEPWTEVPNFGYSEMQDKHYTVDDVAGVVEFGPRIRKPDGLEHQFGVVPPMGQQIRFASYRTGGGIAGNVGARTINVLKSSIPYVASVVNNEPAVGGSDPEDIEHAKWRGPQTLQSRQRAVTAEDFEILAREASSGVSRARAVVVTNPGDRLRPPGVVRLILVPSVAVVEGAMPSDRLILSARVRQDVLSYLDDRRLLGSEVMLDSPIYTWVTVNARLRSRRRADRARVQKDVQGMLYTFIHPSAGGPAGRGWPFGRELYVGEIYALLQGVHGVDSVEEVTLQQFDPSSGNFGKAANRITLESTGLLVSAEHRIQVG
jgi:predicted phage baseplate assembly protein